MHALPVLLGVMLGGIGGRIAPRFGSRICPQFCWLAGMALGEGRGYILPGLMVLGEGRGHVLLLLLLLLLPGMSLIELTRQRRGHILFAHLEDHLLGHLLR